MISTVAALLEGRQPEADEAAPERDVLRVAELRGRDPVTVETGQFRYAGLRPDDKPRAAAGRTRR